MTASSLKSRWQKIPKKGRRWFFWLTGAFLAYVLFGFFGAPAIIKSQLVKRLPDITKRQAAVRQVKFNPLVLSLTIRGLALTEPDGKRFAGWEEFHVNFQASSLFRRAWTFNEVRLVQAYGEVHLLKNGELNLANMFDKTEPEAPKPAQESTGGVPRVHVNLLSITNGFLGVEDHTRRKTFRTEYKPINIRLTDLTTRPGTATPYSFKAENDTNTSLTWAGDVTVHPLASRGSVEVRGMVPGRYQPYLEDFTSAEIVSGKADLRIDYAFTSGSNGVDLTVKNGTFRLADLKIEDPGTKEDVLAVSSIAIEGASLDLRGKQARVGTVRIQDLDLLARINEDQSINLLSLLKPAPTNAPLAASRSVPDTANDPPMPWTVAVGEIHLENAAASFQDQSHNLPFQTRLKPVHLSITNLTTTTNSDAQYVFAITTEALETIGGSGSMSINPIRSQGELKVAGVELKKYWAFAEAHLRGGILGGKLDLGGNYSCALAGTNLSLALSNGMVVVTDLKLKDAATNETVLELESLKLGQIDASLEERKANVGRISTRGTRLIARRQADGAINLLSLLPSGESEAEGTLSPAKSNDQSTTESGQPGGPDGVALPWRVEVREFDMQDWQVRWEDLTLPIPALLRVDNLALNVKGISTDLTQPVELALGLKLNDAGTISVRGTAQGKPRKVSVDIGVAGLDLRPFQPYANPHARLTINSGALNLNGHADYQTAEIDKANAAFKGDISITNLVTTDQLQFEQFVKWTGLYFEGIDFTWQPDVVKVAAIRVDGLKTSLLIDTNKEPNLLAILPVKTNAAPASTPGSTAEKPATETGASPGPQMPVSVSLLALTNVSLLFGDASIQPHCRFEVQQLNGTVKGLSSDAGATADVDISGRVDDQAPFALFGKINPLAQQITLDLTFSNANMQLPSFTPYMEKYAGHPLNKGRLSMALHYAIQENALKAENSFRIDQFTLGARNNSPDATKLPVKLAIALLKDRNGRIELDVPVSGRLDDPEFKIGPIIWKVVLNLITKAATSPFKLLGALVGGGDELSYVDFEAGTAAMLEGETNKLAKLTKALVERPAITLEIDSSVDPDGDRHALARFEVKKQLKTARLEELAATGQTPSEVETFEIDPANYERLLRAKFVKVYGTNWTDALADLRAAAQTNIGMASISGNTNRPSSSVKPKSKLQLALQVVALWIPFEKKNSPTGAARRQAISDARLVRDNPALATLSPDLMEHLLAVKTEVPAEALIALMKARTQAVQEELLRSGEIQADRTFLVAPKPVGAGFHGQARSSLSLN